MFSFISKYFCEKETQWISISNGTHCSEVFHGSLNLLYGTLRLFERQKKYCVPIVCFFNTSIIYFRKSSILFLKCYIYHLVIGQNFPANLFSLPFSINFPKSTTFSLFLWWTFRIFWLKFITFKFRECKCIHIILQFITLKFFI